MRILFVVSIVLGLVGCSADSPESKKSASISVVQAPTAPSGVGAVATVLSTSTGEPVAGASIRIVGFGSVFTGEDGGAVLPSAAKSGSPIVVEAGGYLTRETSLPLDGRIDLFRADSGFVQQLLYGSSLGSLQPLKKPFSRNLTFALAPELAADIGARQAFEAAAQMLESIFEPGVFGISIVTGREATFNVVLDRSLSTDVAAITLRTISPGQVIVGGTISYRTLALARYAQLAAHEMGHCLGLDHTTSLGIMASDARIYSLLEFSPGEKQSLRFLMRRAPGTVYPDNDLIAGTSVASRTLEERSISTSCVLPPPR